MKSGKKMFYGMALLLCLTGCAPGEEKLPASIYDGLTETRLDVKEGMTVRKVLEEAEITIEDGDTVNPSLDSKAAGDKMEISIKRSGENGETDGTETDEIESGEMENKPEEDDGESKSDEKSEKVKTEKPKEEKAGERKIISKEKVYDCDGSGHGYYWIKWSDGTEEYEDF